MTANSEGGSGIGKKPRWTITALKIAIFAVIGGAILLIGNFYLKENLDSARTSEAEGYRSAISMAQEKLKLREGSYSDDLIEVIDELNASNWEDTAERLKSIYSKGNAWCGIVSIAQFRLPDVPVVMTSDDSRSVAFSNSFVDAAQSCEAFLEDR